MPLPPPRPGCGQKWLVAIRPGLEPTFWVLVLTGLKASASTFNRRSFDSDARPFGASSLRMTT